MGSTSSETPNIKGKTMAGKTVDIAELSKMLASVVSAQAEISKRLTPASKSKGIPKVGGMTEAEIEAWRNLSGRYADGTVYVVSDVFAEAFAKAEADGMEAENRPYYSIPKRGRVMELAGLLARKAGLNPADYDAVTGLLMTLRLVGGSFGRKGVDKNGKPWKGGFYSAPGHGSSSPRDGHGAMTLD